MIFHRKKKERSVFTLVDDDDIGLLTAGANDQDFHDVLSGRSSADVETRSYVGNFPSQRTRKIGVGLIGLLFTVFLFRLSSWQIVHGVEFRTVADNNRTRTRTIVPNRGVITDRNGVTLAWNTPTFHLVANRKDLPANPLDRAVRFVAIGSQFGVSSEVFEQRYAAAANDETVLLADDVPYLSAVAFMSETHDDNALSVELASTRSYITNAIPTLSHVLGYSGPIGDAQYNELKAQGYRRFDDIGKQGIEAADEALLRGTPGKEVVEVNAKGKTQRILEKTDAVSGQDLHLAIDSRLTAAIEAIVGNRLKDASTKRAAVVVTDPATGEVLSLVSYPAYDANLFAKGITQEQYSALLNDPNAPLFPRATQGEYPSGSTIKPVYASAALIEGIISPETSFLSTGGLWLGPRFFPDWRPGGHGVTNVYHAIADSVNTFFYIIGGGTDAFQGLGVEKLMKYAALFGFGSPSGIDFPNEKEGFLPTKEAKLERTGEQWFIGDTYNVSIGQGDFLVTPLQINRMTDVFANGGNLVTPHMLKDAPVESTHILDEPTLSTIRSAMRQTITNGSAQSMQAVPVAVAGKTGTAQWAAGKVPHSWFTGFAPFDDPKISITVVVEEGGDAAYAIPIAREILTWYFTNNP